MSIKLIKGDFTQPQRIREDSTVFICHICNDSNLMSSGAAKALFTKWIKVKSYYHECFRAGNDDRLGDIQVVKINDDIRVINMIGQKGMGTKTFNCKDFPAIRYEALEECMHKIAQMLKKTNNPEIHACKFGSKRAGGDWNRIYNMIETIWTDFDVVIYDYEGEFE